MKVIFESEEERRAFAILARALYEIDRNSSHTSMDQVQWEKRIMGADKLEDQIYKLEEEIERLLKETDHLYDQMAGYDQKHDLPEDGREEPEYLALEAKCEQLEGQITQLEEQKAQLEKELKVWELAEEWALYPERWMEWWTQGQEQEEENPPGQGGETE